MVELVERPLILAPAVMSVLLWRGLLLTTVLAVVAAGAAVLVVSKP